MKKLIIIFIFFFTNINHILANTNIVFVDMDKILTTSKAGSSILDQLNKINDKNLNDFKKISNDLKEKEKKIDTQKNIISKEEFKSNFKNLKLEVDKYNEERRVIINNFNRLKADNTNKFLKMINLILVKYSDEKSISIILQKKNLVIGITELDVTDQIIKIIDNDIKVFKIK